MIIPMLTCQDALAEIDFCKKVFVIARAVSEKAKVLLPAEDQFWGDRVGRIMDPAGHVWNIAARINNEN